MFTIEISRLRVPSSSGRKLVGDQAELRGQRRVRVLDAVGLGEHLLEHRVVALLPGDHRRTDGQQRQRRPGPTPRRGGSRTVRRRSLTEAARNSTALRVRKVSPADFAQVCACSSREPR